MHRVPALILLALPTAIAFADGGFREPARLAAGIVVWLLVAACALRAPDPLPRDGVARVALAGLAALLALTLASLAWAPLLGPAYGDAQRLALYLGTLLAALALLRPSPVARLVEPVLAAGTCVVVLVGLSERLAPWFVTLERSVSAGGRLEQPLGYWNAMGALAAIGLVLCAGIAGDTERTMRVRAAAAAAAPLLGTGVALTFSRGALLCAGAGLVVVLLARPLRAQLHATLIAAAGASAAGVLAASLPSVADLTGDGAQGALLAVAIVLGGAGAAASQRALARRPPATLPIGLRRAVAAAGVAAVLAGGVLLLASDQGARTGTPSFGATAQRLASAQSNRYAYWEVALATWSDHPVTGAGSSAFGVEWLRRRTVPEAARDAHSLPLETAAELGVLGLLGLAALLGAVVVAAVAVRTRHAAACGALAAWAVHAALDWGWEMPAVSLVALVLAGLVLAARVPAPSPADVAP